MNVYWIGGREDRWYATLFMEQLENQAYYLLIQLPRNQKEPSITNKRTDTSNKAQIKSSVHLLGSNSLQGRYLLKTQFKRLSRKTWIQPSRLIMVTDLDIFAYSGTSTEVHRTTQCSPLCSVGSQGFPSWETITPLASENITTHLKLEKDPGKTQFGYQDLLDFLLSKGL